MKQKTLLLVFNLFIIISSIWAQSPIEKRNRAVYNRIEYFFNTQNIDSIYHLASSDFKNNISLENFRGSIQPAFSLGKIREVMPVTFSNNTAGYNFLIGNQNASLQLAIDSNYNYYYFLLDYKHIPTKRKEAVKSVVNKQNALDFYVDSIAQAYLSNSNTKSLAIGVINKSSVNTFFYGQNEAGNNTSLPNSNTLYEIGSLSKIFTATLLADLVEKGTVSLDDSITNFLPDSIAQNPFLQKITLKHLANHTSGLPRLPTNFDKVAKYTATNPYANYLRKDLFEYLKGYKSEVEPGEIYTYSNLGYGLLGEIISIITTKSYTQNIKEIITDSLRMPNTVEKINPKTQKLTKVYSEDGNEVPTWNFQAMTAAGSLKSTISDLLRFAQYQFKLPETSLENAMMMTRQFTYYLPPNTDIGLAWHMNMVDDVIQVWHGGATGGSSSFIGLVPDKKSAIIVLSNSAISVDEISSKILSKIANLK
ncbi:serine hydrolase domain-containing protein [Sphingobacterium bovistauri]|uniref:Beta-lactamase n=1 Tax=Sphingobacterium bovistauri TaxID=2781959 RepID=A0ABS7ZA41_9SPHI|nr:serine hydrolase domain-containing protein [Sphingobacterium bovistauri]MCA5005799.1 beta-lactamase family protein [Sphingobacterium bovistauri]